MIWRSEFEACFPIAAINELEAGVVFLCPSVSGRLSHLSMTSKNCRALLNNVKNGAVKVCFQPCSKKTPKHSNLIVTTCLTLEMAYFETWFAPDFG